MIEMDPEGIVLDFLQDQELLVKLFLNLIKKTVEIENSSYVLTMRKQTIIQMVSPMM